jgi:hypothetical protein
MENLVRIGLGVLGILTVMLVMSLSSCSKDDIVVPAPVSVESVDVSDESPTTRALASTPSGWDVVQSATGVKIYKKQSEETYVIGVDLSQGAQIKAFCEFANGVTQATANNPYPLFWKNWRTQDFNLSSYNWFAVANASFFSLYDDPTSLPFFLKKDGTILSTGHNSYSNATTEKPRKFFSINYSGSNGIAIVGNAQWLESDWFSGNTTAYADMQERFQSYQNVFVGLDPLLNDKGKDEQKDRTMVGVNSSGSNVYILVAKSKTQSVANSILTSTFGCNGGVVMFDGSASTQFKSLSSSYKINSTRYIPVFFAIKQG